MPAFLAVCIGSLAAASLARRGLLPDCRRGQFKLHVRAKTGTRIEETARLCDLVEAAIRRQIPHGLASIIDNIGLPSQQHQLHLQQFGTDRKRDADILVSLKPRTPADAPNTCAMLRARLPREFPGTEFFFLPSDIVTQILNFGLPAPIDVQIVGRDLEANRALANRMLGSVAAGARHRRPAHAAAVRSARLQVEADRTKAIAERVHPARRRQQPARHAQRQLSDQPTYWLNPATGVSYSLVTQTPQYDIQSLQDLRIFRAAQPDGTAGDPGRSGLDSPEQRHGDDVDHYDIQPVLDIYGTAHGRDLGAVAGDVKRISMRTGSFCRAARAMILRGQIETMRTSFIGSARRAGFAVVLVYLLMVVNFQSWLDPFIIITALPGALAGIVLDPVRHRHHAQRAGADGRHHVHGRRHRQQHPGGHLRQGAQLEHGDRARGRASRPASRASGRC